MTETTSPTAMPARKGVLGFIERAGNALPDPVFIFFYLIIFLTLVSVALAAMSVSAVHPVTGETIAAKSLVSPENIQKLLVDMPKTFALFHPLGFVAVVMLGAGVAERSGLFAAAMRAAVSDAPKFLMTPIVATVAMIGNLAADAAYVVLIPLSGIIFAAAGRHPIAGIAAAFAGVSGGFSANLIPGQLDALLFGITKTAVDASSIDPSWTVNIAGNALFIVGMLVVFLPVIWFVTDVMLEPRLGKWTRGVIGADGSGTGSMGRLDKRETAGLWAALLALLGVVGLWAFLTFGPGTPLIDEAACADEALAAGTCSFQSRLTPFYTSLVAWFFVLFLAAGWAYGAVVGTVKSHRDIVAMMTGAMRDLAYYFVLVFAVAHFVAMFGWSNLGLIMAVEGAQALKTSGLSAPFLLGGIVVLTAGVNLFVGSASAKWGLLAPILVPMMMLLGISPEMTTAAYRVGDGATNIVTPLMVYFPLVLTFCQRWEKDFGLGSLMATMLPYSLGILIFGTAMTVGWVALDLPLGGGAVVDYTLPQAAAAPR